MNSSGALVIFVKTPGLTPVKTRLAASIGQASAEAFYKLSLAATAALGKKLREHILDIKIYWAVAEHDGLKKTIWSDFPTISQGTGSLGDRLSFVYSAILERHSFACFIGSDSPHLTVKELEDGVLLTKKNLGKNFVLGETSDGGFYFFGGSTILPPRIWQSVEYGTSKTAAQLKKRIAEFGEIDSMATNFDIDILEDLRKYSDKEFQGRDLLQEQKILINWAASLEINDL